MTSSASNSIYMILTVSALVVLLSACAPPRSVPSSSNSTHEMRQLHSSLTTQEQALQDLSRQVAELENRLQRQAEEIEQLRQSSPQAHADQQSNRTWLPSSASSAPEQGDGSPTEVYLQAFGDYASGRYQAATHGFESFLKRFPNNGYASNAQFWLGDCYFNQQQYPLAIQEFERVLNEYPSAPKSPDALLKIAIAQLQLGATDEARTAIDTLTRRYPKSPATQKAQELAIP